METLLASDTPLVKEAWIWMQEWCHDVEYIPPPVKGYHWLNYHGEDSNILEGPPPGWNILVALTPFPVDNSIPKDEEVAWLVCCHHWNRSRGLSGMRVEHLWSCLQIATREEYPGPTHWWEVVGLIQAAFR